VHSDLIVSETLHCTPRSPPISACN